MNAFGLACQALLKWPQLFRAAPGCARYVPFRHFCLGFCLLGPSGLESGLLVWIWGLPSWSLAFGGLLRLIQNSCGFLGLFVFCCTVATYLPTNLFTLSAHLLRAQRTSPKLKRRRPPKARLQPRVHPRRLYSSPEGPSKQESSPKPPKTARMRQKPRNRRKGT